MQHTARTGTPAVTLTLACLPAVRVLSVISLGHVPARQPLRTYRPSDMSHAAHVLSVIEAFRACAVRRVPVRLP